MEKALVIWHYFQVIAPWLVVSLLPSLITGLSQFPKAGGIVSVLKQVLAALSVLTHADSPGTFKLPLAPAKAPNGVHSSSGMIGVLLPLAFLALSMSGCGTTSAQWKAAGIDTAKCLAPAVMNAAADAIVDSLDQLGGGGPVDWKTFGISMASRYGLTTALCAFGKIWADLRTPSATEAKMVRPPDPRVQAVAWLLDHQSEWSK